MADKQSIAEAVSSIRKQRRLVKKSLAGIERKFYYDLEPNKALTTAEGTAVMNPVPVAVPMAEVETAESRDRRGRPRKEKKETIVKDKVAKIENNLGKVRVKRTMTLFL